VAVSCSFNRALQSEAANEERSMGFAWCYRAPMSNVFYVSFYDQQPSMKYQAANVNLIEQLDACVEVILRVEVRCGRQ